MKNKKKKTTTEQFIDDLIASGIPLGNELKKYFQENKDKLKEVDEKFYSHIYPQIKLNWCKLYNNNLEITKKTDKASINILNILYKLINRNNFIQISTSEIIKLTGYSNKTIIKSIDELIEKGFIAIKLKAEPKVSRSTIYMINPELVTIGTGNQTQLKKEFWKLTGSKYKLNNLEKPSKIHTNWLDMIENENYIIGYDKIQIDNEIIYFNKLSQKEKQKKMSATIEKLQTKYSNKL